MALLHDEKFMCAGSLNPEASNLTTRPGLSNEGSAEAVVPRVLLTDTNRWPSPARIAIGLAKLGCRIFAICPPKGHPISVTSVVEEVFHYSSVRPLESVARAISACNPDIVIPCDDRSVEHLHELHERARMWGPAGSSLCKLIEYSVGQAASFSVVSRRQDLLRVAHEEGIRIPEFQPLISAGDLNSWQLGHPFPWVLKGDGTFGGKGVRIVARLERAQQAFEELTRLFGAVRAIKRAIVNRDPFWLRPWWHGQRPAVLVQSHIQGRPANCSFVCWEGQVHGIVCVEVLSSDGITGPARLVRVVRNPDMMLAAERLSRRLNLSGFFGLDFMIEEGTGATYMIEMNPRCTPLTHLQLGEGRDLITALAARLLGRELPVPPPVTENELIAYFPQSAEIENDLLQSYFQDIPQGEPALVNTLLTPWQDRSFFYRVVSRLSIPSPGVSHHGTHKDEAVPMTPNSEPSSRNCE